MTISQQLHYELESFAQDIKNSSPDITAAVMNQCMTNIMHVVQKNFDQELSRKSALDHTFNNFVRQPGAKVPGWAYRKPSSLSR